MHVVYFGRCPRDQAMETERKFLQPRVLFSLVTTVDEWSWAHLDEGRGETDSTKAAPVLAGEHLAIGKAVAAGSFSRPGPTHVSEACGPRTGCSLTACQLWDTEQTSRENSTTQEERGCAPGHSRPCPGVPLSEQHHKSQEPAV